MTEAEWQQYVNVEPMLRELHKVFGGEKIRLFGCVVYRRVWDRLDNGFRYLLGITEEWATSALSLDEWRDAWDRNPNPFHAGAFGDDAQIVRSLVTSTYSYVLSAAWRAAVGARQIAISHAPGESHKGFDKAERKWQAGVLRDLYGNPFHPVAVDPSWLTPDVRILAEGIYQDRAFDRMPILADALQDAGCDHADILQHCRGEGPHVRGCWVVDLLLGKE